jgi:protein-tyrosine phosphatase
LTSPGGFEGGGNPFLIGNDFNTLTPKLTIGAAPNDWDAVWDEYDVVVQLIRQRVYVPDGKVYMTWPIEDGPLPDLTQLAAIANATASGISRGKRTLVVCGAGLNRSGLVCALVVRLLYGMAGTDAVDFVQARRDFALCNEVFEAYVRTLQPLVGVQAGRALGIEPIYWLNGSAIMLNGKTFPALRRRDAPSDRRLFGMAGRGLLEQVQRRQGRTRHKQVMG